MPKTCRTREWERWSCGTIPSGEESPALHWEFHTAAEHGNYRRAAEQHGEGSVLTSACLCYTPRSGSGSSHRQEPNGSEFKPNPCTGLGMLSPSSGHAACDKDLGLTLGRFILNNLFAPVCRAGDHVAGASTRQSQQWGLLLQGQEEWVY